MAVETKLFWFDPWFLEITGQVTDLQMAKDEKAQESTVTETDAEETKMKEKTMRLGRRTWYVIISYTCTHLMYICMYTYIYIYILTVYIVFIMDNRFGYF